MGLHLAWPDAQIVGIDIEPQPRYPFRHLQMDWRKATTYWQPGAFDFIWASPPCQGYTAMNHRWNTKRERHPLLIDPVREWLKSTGMPWAIENVETAPLINPVTLCGQFFGLKVRRHRKIETSFAVVQPNCKPYHTPEPIAVYGDHPEKHKRRPGTGGFVNRAHDLKMGQEAMGIDWMEWKELTQAIPPAYSRYIAEQYSQSLGVAAGGNTIPS